MNKVFKLIPLLFILSISACSSSMTASEINDYCSSVMVENGYNKDPNYRKTNYNERILLTYQILYKNGYLTFYSAYDTDYYRKASEEEKLDMANVIKTSNTIEEITNNNILSNIIDDYEKQGYTTVFLPPVYNHNDVVLSNAQLLFVKITEGK